MLDSCLLAFFAATLPLAPDPGRHLAAGDPERREPAPSAPAHSVFAWTSEQGLRYTWCLPEGYSSDKPVALTVICHGTGLDYRWGHWNNPAGVFRPDDVVVSVDGPAPDGESRLFLGEPKDAAAMRDFLKEMRATFAVSQVFLYGHSQGGFFVVYFAGEYPDAVAGVVAHASGAWNWSKTGKNVRKVAIAFMHGTMDPVVPYGQSPGSRDHYAKEGFELLHLRRLPFYNHWPNAVRATEELDWCEGMTTPDPARALELARAILRPKKPDEYQWETVVGFSAARQVLRRFEGKGPAAFGAGDGAKSGKSLAPELLAETRMLADEIEAEGERHVKLLRNELASKKDLKLDGRPWLGHLVSLREDFRGVESVEAYLRVLGFDELLKSHEQAASKIRKAWYDSQDKPGIFETVATQIENAFLVEGLPPELAERMREWEQDAKGLGLSKKALAKYPDFEAWKHGWDEGAKQYRELWKDWKGPARK